MSQRQKRESGKKRRVGKGGEGSRETMDQSTTEVGWREKRRGRRRKEEGRKENGDGDEGMER